MHRLSSLIFLALGTMAPLNAQTHLANTFPPPLTLSYSISTSRLPIAEVTDVLNFDQQSFRIQSEGRGAGLFALISRARITRNSEGEVRPEGLRPTRYSESRGNNERSLGARFDWPKQKLILSRDQEQEEVELPAGSLDRLSFPYSFAFLPKPPPQWKLAVTDGRYLTPYEFKLVGEEVISTPLGEFPAMVVCSSMALPPINRPPPPAHREA